MNKAYVVKRTEGNVLGEAQSFLITPENVLFGPNGNIISVIPTENLEEKIEKTDIIFKNRDSSKLKKILVNGERYKVQVYQDKNGILQVVPYDNKFSQWGKQATATIGLLASLLLFYACPNTSTNGNGNGDTIKKGNLSGRISGLIKGGYMSGVTVSLPSSGKSATTDGNGNFTITDILNPSQYKRIRMRGSDIIDRETNIKGLGSGENNAGDINIIEGDNISGFEYDDYLTVNKGGARIVSSIPLKHHFFNESVWGYNSSSNKYEKIGTLESLGAEEYTIAQDWIEEVFKNDFPEMTKGLQTDTKVYLESLGEDGPDRPPTSTAKQGWLVSYICKGINSLRTAFYTNSKGEIIGARLSIPFFEKQPNYGRKGFVQDICEWAGFTDQLKKHNVSIFTDDDNGFTVSLSVTNLDIYFATIKYNRAVGHSSSGDIPDYDPSGSGSLTIYVVNTLGVNPSTYNSHKSSFLRNPSDLGREFTEQTEYDARYRQWELQNEKRTEQIIKKRLQEKKNLKIN